MTLDENLNLLNDTKKRIKASLDIKVQQSTDNKPFGEYHTIVDGIKQFSTNIEDYTITDTTRLSEYTGDSFTLFSHIKSVNIPTTVTSLSSQCFSGCSSLIEITIPDSVTSIGNTCFKNCSSLTGITIPNGVISLSSQCFYGCSSLTGITIPESVTSLRDWCFSICSSLKEITIPDAVTSIEMYCFYLCRSLTSVTCKATTPPNLGATAFYSNPSTMVIYVPAESVDAYKSATNWSKYADKIQAITS